LDDYLNAPTDHRPEAEPWSAGRCRVFLSHLADQRAVADQMTSVLDWWGIDGFVAHKGIDPGKAWVRVINAAPSTSDALARPDAGRHRLRVLARPHGVS
jgi:hypothetical protein